MVGSILRLRRTVKQAVDYLTKRQVSCDEQELEQWIAKGFHGVREGNSSWESELAELEVLCSLVKEDPNCDTRTYLEYLEDEVHNLRLQIQRLSQEKIS